MCYFLSYLREGIYSIFFLRATSNWSDYNGKGALILEHEGNESSALQQNIHISLTISHVPLTRFANSIMESENPKRIEGVRLIIWIYH